MKKRAFRIPIAFKLIALTLSLLLTITFLIAWKSSSYFEREVRMTHERSLQVQVQDRAYQVESILQGYVDKIHKVAAALELGRTATGLTQLEEIVFQNDRDLVQLDILENSDSGPHSSLRVRGRKFLEAKKLNPARLDALAAGDRQLAVALFRGEIEIRNASPSVGIPLLTLGIPLIKNQAGEVTHVAIAKIDLAPLQRAFANEGAAQIYLVDADGMIMAHPEDALVLANEDFSVNPLVLEAQEAKFRVNHLPSFWNPRDEKTYYGAYSKTAFKVFVIGEIPETLIREPAEHVRRQAFYIGGLVLSASIALIFLFSITLTRPIEKLLGLTEEISRGNFDIHAGDKVRSKDEVNDLAIAFDHMATGLKALVKTQGADVAKTLMESDLENLGGTKRHVVVLFSDLRDFTKFSEGHSPEEVVTMLNEYFEEMVACIERHHGRVNKFIGDAIMAMWGAPDATPDDAANAVRAALDMRRALNALNDRRIARGDSPIRIGVGIHTGEAVAGTIGSRSRLEYTVIGDTVNQASRIEASTKAFGVDLLVSAEVCDAVGERFISEYLGAAEVKGKSEPLRMFGVNGIRDADGHEDLIQTPYSRYKAEAADKVKIA